MWILCGIIFLLGIFLIEKHHSKYKNKKQNLNDENRVRRYRLVKNFRVIKNGDYLLNKDGKTYHWRPDWQDAYVDEVTASKEEL